MEWNFWASKLGDGKSVVLGEEVSTVLSNAILADGKGMASVFVNNNLLCVLTEKRPHGYFKPVLPFDQPTTIKIQGSAVELSGYTINAALDRLLSRMQFALDKAADKPPAPPVAASKKETPTAAAPSPKAAPGQSPKVAAQVEEPKKSKKARKDSNVMTVELGDGEPVDITDMQLDIPEESDDDAEGVNCGEIEIEGKSYFLDHQTWKLYQGSLDDAEFVGYWDQELRVITNEPPKHSFVPDETKLLQKQVEHARQAFKTKRAEWEAEHGNESDATIDSGEEETFKTKSAFHKKRRTESVKKDKKIVSA